MHKFTIFTILLSVTVVLVTLELVFNSQAEMNFSRFPDTEVENATTNVFSNRFAQGEVQQKGFGDASEEVSEQDSGQDSRQVSEQDSEQASGAVSQEISGGDFLENETPETTHAAPPSLTIDEILLSLSGIMEPAIRSVPFQGKLFQTIDIFEYDLSETLKANIFQGTQFLFSVYEISAGEVKLAQEILRLIQEEALQTQYFSVNPTNQFGDGSAYLNHSNKKQTVFLVVVIGDTVFAFEYPRTSHEIVKNVLGILKKS